MRVLALTNLYPSSREPTRGVFNRQTFEALSRYCEVRVVSPRPWWGRIGRPAELVSVPRESSGGVVSSYPAYWSVPQLHALHGRMLYRSLRNHVAKIHREFPFDVILAAWAYPDAFAAALLAADYRCPLVVTVLGSDINDLAFRPSIRQKVRWALERAAMVVAVSAALRNRLVELGLPAERVAVQYNAVNGEMFKPRDKRDARARLGLPVDTPLVGYIGNFVREKGVDVLVEASGLLPRSGDRPATMVLVGSGPMQQQLQNRTNELGLAERVIFAGRRTHTEIPDWMSAFDILVLPSRSEGCPNVVLEALASGVPTVGTTVGGVPELLDRNNGVLVAPDDALSLASGIRAALEQDWSPDYLRSTVKYLSWDDVGRAYWDLLRGISST